MKKFGDEILKDGMTEEEKKEFKKYLFLMLLFVVIFVINLIFYWQYTLGIIAIIISLIGIIYFGRQLHRIRI